MYSNILIVLLILAVVYILVGGDSEPFQPFYSQAAHDMCHELTVQNCRIPTVALNDCWTNQYFKCQEKCNNPNGDVCGCATKASSMCQSSSSPAEECHLSTYKKCMAGRVPGFPDPDRHTI